MDTLIFLYNLPVEIVLFLFNFCFWFGFAYAICEGIRTWFWK